MKTTPDDRWGGSSVAVNGPVLRVLRQWAGLNAADLARAIEMHRSYVSKLESGALLRVSPSSYQRLMNVLRIDDRRVLLACANCPAIETSETAADREGETAQSTA